MMKVYASLTADSSVIMCQKLILIQTHFCLKAAAKGDADAVSVRVSALEKDWSSLKQSLEPRLIEAREQEDSLLNFKQKIQHLESQLKVLKAGMLQLLPKQVLCNIYSSS